MYYNRESARRYFINASTPMFYWFQVILLSRLIFSKISCAVFSYSYLNKKYLYFSPLNFTEKNYISDVTEGVRRPCGKKLSILKEHKDKIFFLVYLIL